MIRKSRNRLSEKIMLQKNAVKPRVQRQCFCFKRASAARIGATEPYLCCVALKPSRYGPYSLFASRFSGKVRLLGRRRNKTPALSAGDVHAARKLGGVASGSGRRRPAYATERLMLSTSPRLDLNRMDLEGMELEALAPAPPRASGPIVR